MSEAQSLRIPQELIDYVISFLWDCPSVLDAWKLVSRACYSYVTTFSGFLKLSSNAFSVLSRSPRAAEKLLDVRALLLRDSTTPWLHRVPLRLGPTLANVTNLYLYDWSPVRTPLHPAVLSAFAHLCSVRRLFLYECRFEGVAQLQRLLGAFQGLLMLTLRGVYIPLHKASEAGASKVVCRAPPRVSHLTLGTSWRKQPEKGEANVASALAAWFSEDSVRLQKLQGLSVQITYAHLHESELASIGALVTAVGSHVSQLMLDFEGAQSGAPGPAVDWSSLKLDSCVKVREVWVYRSSPELHELALLSPECRIRSLHLAHGVWYRERQDTRWTALAAALEGSAYNELEWVVNHARIPRGRAEKRALKAFIMRMQARSVKFVPSTENPWLYDNKIHVS